MGVSMILIESNESNDAIKPNPGCASGAVGASLQRERAAPAVSYFSKCNGDCASCPLVKRH